MLYLFYTRFSVPSEKGHLDNKISQTHFPFRKKTVIDYPYILAPVTVAGDYSINCFKEKIWRRKTIH